MIGPGSGSERAKLCPPTNLQSLNLQFLIYNLTPYLTKITKEQRAQLLGQKPFLVWFTGLSGSGKSTLANHLELVLQEQGYKTYLLDGDNLRTGLNKDLGFSPQDRVENIRRVGEVARLMMEAGLIVIAAFISPMEKEREMLRELIGSDDFFEIHVNCPIEKCEARDPKGLYKQMRAGLIKNFTGIDAPYEIPLHPALIVNTEKETIATSLQKVLTSLKL